MTAEEWLNNYQKTDEYKQQNCEEDDIIIAFKAGLKEGLSRSVKTVEKATSNYEFEQDVPPIGTLIIKG